jgi:hypothetical protein
MQKERTVDTQLHRNWCLKLTGETALSIICLKLGQSLRLLGATTPTEKNLIKGVSRRFNS